ncbi:MAG TPA: MFS transporter [Burkholderiales bacterium]
MHNDKRSAPSLLLFLGILLIAANLRAPFTALGPMLGPVRTALDLSLAAAGALIALPLLIFALVSPFGVWITRAFGLERALLGALVAVALGILVRSLGFVWSLYLGTLILSIGIAIGNVLLPSLVKRDFSRKVAATTGTYSLVMGLCAALASAIAIPLISAWGWRLALASFLILPIGALVVWIGQMRHGQDSLGPLMPPAERAPIWRSMLAWQVTLFLGINSTVYYVGVSYLPAILIDAGHSPAEAGSLHGVMQLFTAIPGLLLGPVVGRMRRQSLPAVVIGSLATVSLAGLLTAPQYAFAWSALFGLAGGGCFMLGIAFIGLRARNTQQATALSSMAQCGGYLLAGLAPMAMGALRDRLGNWTVPLWICLALSLAMMIMGWLAGRDRYVGDAANFQLS